MLKVAASVIPLWKNNHPPPQNSNVASRQAADSVFSSLFVLLLMREREAKERRVSYLFRETFEDTRKEHHATGTTANLRENIL